MVHAVERTSKAVEMAFGMKKCATASMLGGKVIGGRPLPLNGTEMMGALGAEDSYRYLGLEQLFDPNVKIVKDAVKEVVKARTRKVVNSKLSGGNKPFATNSWVLSVIRYYMTPMTWSWSPWTVESAVS